jgi:hypothetical protein
MPQFLFNGGDGYDFKAAGQLLNDPEEAPTDAEVVMDALKEAKRIAPKTDGRIIGVMPVSVIKPSQKVMQISKKIPVQHRARRK